MTNRLNQFFGMEDDNSGELSDFDKLVQHLKGGRSLAESVAGMSELDPNNSKPHLDELVSILTQQVEQMKAVIPTIGMVCGKFTPEGRIVFETHFFVLKEHTIDFSDSEAKQKFMEGLGREVLKQQLMPLAVAMMTEAWMSSNPDMRASEDPNRKEVVVIAGSVGNIHSHFRSAEIHRGDSGKIESFGEWEEQPVPLMGMTLLVSFYRGYIAANSGRLENMAGRPIQSQEDAEKYAKELIEELERQATSGSGEPEVDDELGDDFQKWIDNH